jgi:PIN domain nuclease of toxin-antitoxin system
LTAFDASALLAFVQGAAHRWRAGDGLSLGDRLCLALGERLDDDVLTADRRCGDDGRVIQIR